MSRRRGQRERAGIDPSPSGYDEFPLLHVLTGRPDRATRLNRFGHRHPLQAAIGSLHHHNGIGTGRHHRAGHDAHGFTRPNLQSTRVRARGHLANDRERHRRGSRGADHGGGSHGIPIHGGVVEARQRDA